MQESGEMYLETIRILSDEMPSVRAIDIGTYMGFSKPSVSRAMRLLKEDGYITVDDGGYILLTEKGQKIADKMYERHMMLSKVLMKLGVDEKTATDDACRIEHVISEESFIAIRDYFKRVK